MEYKITRVSGKPPKSWSFPDKKTGGTVSMETYKVMLEGIDEPAEINKKAGNVPKEGEVLYGTVETTDYGKRFKAIARPNPQATYSSYRSSSKGLDDSSKSRAMYVAYAKDIAVALLETKGFTTVGFEEIVKAVADKGDYLFEHATLGLSITKDVEESLEGKGRVDAVLGKTERVDVADPF